jgi:hypothetical protein
MPHRSDGRSTTPARGPLAHYMHECVGQSTHAVTAWARALFAARTMEQRGQSSGQIPYVRIDPAGAAGQSLSMHRTHAGFAMKRDGGLLA